MLLKVQIKIPISEVERIDSSIDYEAHAKYKMTQLLVENIVENFLCPSKKEIRDEIVFDSEIVVMRKEVADLVNEHLQKGMEYFNHTGDTASYERLRLIGQLVFKH